MDRPLDIGGIENTELFQALEMVKAGKLEEALPFTEKYLEAHPDSAPAHEIRGVILVLQDKIEAGLAELKEAVLINPRQTTALTKMGDVYFSRGERDRARVYFQQAIALNPQDRHPHQRLGILFEEDGNVAEAISHFEKGIVGTPEDYVGIKTNLGSLYNRTRQFGKTTALLEPAVDEDTANPTAQLVLGTAYLGLGQVDKALERFELAESFSEDPDQLALAFGIAYRDAGELEKSEAELNKALAAKPASAAAHLQLGETLAAMKRIPEAAEHFQRAAAAPEAQVLAAHRLAKLYAENGQPDKAIEAYKSLEKQEKATLATYLGLAEVYTSTDHLDEAEGALRDGARRFPENPEADYRLGMHLALMRQYSPANVVLERARSKSPADPRIQKALSLVAFRQGDLAKAIVEGEKVLALVPDSVGDRFYLATLLEQANRTEDAAAHYESILEARPDEIATLNNLANLRMKTGDAESALELSGKALDLAPENSTVLDTHGWILFQAGKTKEALPDLKKAVSLSGDQASPTHRYHLAVVCHQLGLTDEAREQLELALKEGADFPEKKQALTLQQRVR